MAKAALENTTLPVDANGNKIVQPVYNGSGGCVGGMIDIKRDK